MQHWSLSEYHNALSHLHMTEDLEPVASKTFICLHWHLWPCNSRGSLGQWGYESSFDIKECFITMHEEATKGYMKQR